MKNKTNCKCMKSRHGVDGILLATLIIEAAISALAIIYPLFDDFEIGAAIVRDINVLFISINATLIGLYVTAFIFLNDSLKARVKDDPTLSGAVSSILNRYRTYMIWFSFGTIASIVLEVISNITLGGNGREDLENWAIHTSDPRWFFFIGASVVALIVMTMIIYFSKQITDSDGLIAGYSQKNLIAHGKKIHEFYNDILEDAKKKRAESDGSCTSGTLFCEFDPANPNNGITPENNASDYLVDIVNQHKIDVLGRIVPIDCTPEDGDGKCDEKVSPLLPYFFSLCDIYSRRGKDLYDEGFYVLRKEDSKKSSETEIIFGKRVRFLETIISKISENNIDKSIMKDKFIYESMRSGYQWVYARKRNKKGSPDAMAKPQNSTTFVDIRDEKRFLDYVKYKLITDPVFKRRPFNNRAIEELFDKVSAEFKTMPYKKDYRPKTIEDAENAALKHFETKIKRIAAYKDDMSAIIEEFFRGYEHIIGYRDALVHFRKFSESHGKPREASKARNEHALVNDYIIKVNAYAELLIRVMIDRFTSFVKINDLNLGNSTFDKGWFNYSELSDSNFTHSSFHFSRIENAILKNCDLSTCNFVNTDASETNFTESNFSYSNLTGMDMRGALLDRAQMNNVILRDPLMDRYDGLAALFAEPVKTPESLKFIEELYTWLHTDPGDEFKGAHFAKRIDDFIHSIHEELRVDPDDTDVSLTGDESLDGIYEGLAEDLKSLKESHYNYKIPECYFEKLTERRNFEAQRQPKGEGSSPYATELTKQKREEFYGRLDFGVANLSSVSGESVQLKNIDFSHVNMEDASLTDSDLSNAEMYYTTAKNIMLRASSMNDLDAYKTDFSNANFTNAKLMNALFLNCNLSETTFDQAILHHATFVSTLEDVSAGDDHMYVARFSRARTDTDDNKKILSHFEKPVDSFIEHTESGERAVSVTDITGKETFSLCANSTFTNILANNISFINVNTMRSAFDGAMMKDSLIYNALMRWCTFESVKMENSLLIATSFSHSNFSDAELSRARLFGCEFANVNFLGTKLISTDISKCLFEDCNLTDAKLSSSDIQNSTFIGCAFDGVNLTGVTFRNCIFYDFDFSNAIGLKAAKFVNCVFALKDLTYSNESMLSLDMKDITSRKGNVKVHRSSDDDGLVRFSTDISA